MPANRAPLRILVVEDDFLIRLNTVEMLAELGHQVCEAPSAEDALSQTESASFDILLTDMGLPRMSGAALAAAIRARQPGIAIIFATGHGGIPSLEGGSAAILLQKPFDIEHLLKALEIARGSLT